VNVSSGGAQGDGTGSEFYLSAPVLSADGRYVAFESFSDETS
jgi:hypothetical protein